MRTINKDFLESISPYIFDEFDNKLQVGQGIEISITPGFYVFDDLIKEIEIQVKKHHKDATVSVKEGNVIIVDIPERFKLPLENL
ncbi:MAG TPA: hypothetical protein VMW53_08950 [archaeon]|nr:hypothetical protein [archaeon]